MTYAKNSVTNLLEHSPCNKYELSEIPMTSAMPTDKLDKLRQRRDQLNEQIRRSEGRERARQFKEDTRRKILIGAVVLQDAEADPEAMRYLRKRLDQKLVRPTDRALFNLAVASPASADETSKAPGSQSKAANGAERSDVPAE